MRLQSNGLLERWYKQHVARDTCFDDRLSETEPVTLQDLTYVFLFVLATGLVAASLALLLELVYKEAIRQLSNLYLAIICEQLRMFV